MRVLVVEDDRELAAQIERVLRRAGYAVDVAHDGERGRSRGATEPYDAVVLDLGLPGLDGLSVLERWRRQGRTMPVLILSARDTWRDKVVGLRGGADDYLAKPFEGEELLARLEALIRRAAGRAAATLTCGPLWLDPAAARVTLRGASLVLTAFEYRLLAYLMHHAGKVVSKAELSEHLYSYDADRDSNTIEVLINRLRRKLGEGLIHTHRGQGYRLAATEGDT